MASASSCAPTVKSNTIWYLNSKMFVLQNLLHSRVFQAFNVSYRYHVFSKFGIGGQLLQGSNYLLTCFMEKCYLSTIWYTDYLIDWIHELTMIIDIDWLIWIDWSNLITVVIDFYWLLNLTICWLLMWWLTYCAVACSPTRW